MTAEMPRTKPNIMMTARLLLMPVLRSVELNVVLWAKAETVLRANRVATVRSGRSRERIFRADIFFMALFYLFRFPVQRFFRRIMRIQLPATPMTNVYVIHKMQLGFC